MIGSYQTWIGGSKERHSNITRAAKALNNTLVYEGAIFSFNDVVGPRTEARGYLPAPVIISGSMEIDYGGGVCQVSSTLFNAADQAGLKVIERHVHSRPVRYVPEGRDAAVAYNALDLKLKNCLDSPVIIKAGLSGNSLWVNILGRK